MEAVLHGHRAAGVAAVCAPVSVHNPRSERSGQPRGAGNRRCAGRCRLWMCDVQFAGIVKNRRLTQVFRCLPVKSCCAECAAY
ncbi:hypothetical protein G6F40_018235 [Rhizopus arrhizus]|nr:hypothetical protein G6F40_018235 [Rhizopus arrhizus]